MYKEYPALTELKILLEHCDQIKISPPVIGDGIFTITTHNGIALTICATDLGWWIHRGSQKDNYYVSLYELFEEIESVCKFLNINDTTGVVTISDFNDYIEFVGPQIDPQTNLESQKIKHKKKIYKILKQNLTEDQLEIVSNSENHSALIESIMCGNEWKAFYNIIKKDQEEDQKENQEKTK